MFFDFSQNHVSQNRNPDFLFFFLNNRKIFFSFERACKGAGHIIVRFLKEAFFMPQKSCPKNLHADFWPFFEDLNLWKLFCACKLTFQKSDDDVPSHVVKIAAIFPIF